MGDILDLSSRLRRNVWVGVYAKRIHDMGAAEALKWALKQYGPTNERQIRPLARGVAAKL